MQQGRLGGRVAVEHAKQAEQEQHGASKTARAKGKTKTTASRPIQIATRISQHQSSLLGSVFGGTDFPRIFIFEPPDFSWILFPDFSPHFVGKSGQKNPPGKSPANLPKYIQQKSPTNSAEGPGQSL